jgi:RNA polymerase sigma-70 factor (ECF subfamily)
LSVSAADRDAFLDALPAARRARFAELPDLDARIAGWLERAAAAWPELALAPGVLLPYLAERLTAVTDDPHVEDLALACACVVGDPKALAALDRQFFREIDGTATRLRASAAVLDDAKPRLRQRLLVAVDGARPRIAEYGGRGKLRTWLRVAITREVLRLLERTEAERPFDENRLAALPFRADDPELLVMQAQAKEQFDVAFREAIASLTERERNLLRQSYLDGLSIDELGDLYKVHRATIARWLNKATETLFDRTRTRLMEQLAMTPELCDSFLRILQSRLDVSIRHYLA